jgi:hypothetical protein
MILQVVNTASSGLLRTKTNTSGFFHSIVVPPMMRWFDNSRNIIFGFMPECPKVIKEKNAFHAHLKG